MHAAGEKLDVPPPEGALPSMGEASISVVFLADAFCPDAAQIVSSWEEHLSSLKRDFEILVVGSESNLDLVGLRESLSNQNTIARVVTYSDTPGDGPALRTILATARHPLLLYLPCDRQYHPRDLERLLQAINEVHLAIGYRVYQPIPGWLAWMDLAKRFFSRIILGAAPQKRECWLGWKRWRRRFFARWIFGLHLQDVECQFRLMRLEFFQKFPIQSQGTFAHLELLAKANHLECIMAEAPVSWIPPAQVKDDPTYALDRKRIMRHAEFVHPHIETADEKVVTEPAPEG